MTSVVIIVMFYIHLNFHRGALTAEQDFDTLGANASQPIIKTDTGVGTKQVRARVVQVLTLWFRIWLVVIYSHYETILEHGKSTSVWLRDASGRVLTATVLSTLEMNTDNGTTAGRGGGGSAPLLSFVVKFGPA